MQKYLDTVNPVIMSFLDSAQKFYSDQAKAWSEQQTKMASMQTEVGTAVEKVDAINERLDKLERQMDTVIKSLTAAHTVIAPLTHELAKEQVEHATHQSHANLTEHINKALGPHKPDEENAPDTLPADAAHMPDTLPADLPEGSIPMTPSKVIPQTPPTPSTPESPILGGEFTQEEIDKARGMPSMSQKRPREDLGDEDNDGPPSRQPREWEEFTPPRAGNVLSPVEAEGRRVTFASNAAVNPFTPDPPPSGPPLELPVEGNGSSDDDLM